MQSGFTSIRYADVGTPLPALSQSPVIWPTSPDAAANAVQTITVSGGSSGTFTLTFGGATTGDIAYDEIAAMVEEALEALSTIGEGNVKVTGDPGGPFTVEFIRDLGKQDVAELTANDSNTDATVAVAEVTPGSAGGGIWLPVPNIDPEKDVRLVPDSTVRSLYSPGSSRPTQTHIIRVAIAEIQLVTTESAMEALEFIFPAFDKPNANTMALSAVSKESPYVALALEVPEGVFEFKKVAPNHETQIDLLFNDITQPEFTLVTHEDANRDVGFFHKFTA